MSKALVRNVPVMAVLFFISLAIAACGSKVQGTYSDQAGAFVLDLKSGGKATFTFAGEAAACNYLVDGSKVTLDCKGMPSKAILTIHDDGSLTGPPGTFMPALRKAK